MTTAAAQPPGGDEQSWCGHTANDDQGESCDARDCAACLMDVDDGKLLRLIGEGDRKAFDVLYARNAPWLVLRLRRPVSRSGVGPGYRLRAAHVLRSGQGALVCRLFDRSGIQQWQPGERMREDELRGLAQRSPWLIRALGVVRDSGLPDAWIGAGAIRDLVWAERYGQGFDPSSVRDVDVVFLDPTDLSRDNDDRATRRLVAAWPEPPWEAKNQAAVHTWYPVKFGGGPVTPLRTIADAVATWPEYATAVAVRLDVHDQVVVCAPHGLDDLLDGVWRRNPTRVSPEVSRQRLARHRPAERWPGVRVLV